ncbi:Sporulation stage 0, Spo0E-like regulatory phosphatase [Bacillus freudenreichii]|nr:Sporulation stage 0, Spo0E-like regulatory phosphatase [Bacillus freudenreichii]
MFESSMDQVSFLAKIQRKREEMFILGEKHGLVAKETIACSHELDQLLNDYYHIYQSNTSAKTNNQSRKQYVLFSKPFPTRQVQSS